MKLEAQIKKWQEAGLISNKEAQAILQFEDKQPEKSYILYGIVAIGITTLALGLVSIIAANWSEITPLTKLISYFILQCGLGFGYLKTSEDRSLLKAGFLWLFTLNFFGGIGLISQIFQLSGPAWKPFVFWLSLAILPTLLEKRKLLIHIWMITFFITVILFLASYNYNLLYFCSAAFAITAIGFNGITRFLGFSENFEAIALKYGIAMLLLSSSFIGNTLWIDTYKTLQTHNSDTTVAITALFLTTCITKLSAYFRSPAINRDVILRVICLSALILFYVALPYYTPPTLFSELRNQVIGAMGFIAIWVLAAWIAAVLNAKRLYNLFTLVVAIRLIGVYFEVFGSLLATGFGLILSGFVILLTAYLWNRYRQTFLQWVQKTL